MLIQVDPMWIQVDPMLIQGDPMWIQYGHWFQPVTGHVEVVMSGRAGPHGAVGHVDSRGAAWVAMSRVGSHGAARGHEGGHGPCRRPWGRVGPQWTMYLWYNWLCGPTVQGVPTIQGGPTAACLL